MYEYLHSVTLASLVEQQRQKAGPVSVLRDERSSTACRSGSKLTPDGLNFGSATVFAPVYLDHNATTPLDQLVREAMLPWLGDRFGNASSRHEYGRAARKAIDEARSRVAAAVNAHPTEVIFTSGGSEANNLFIKGAAAHDETRVGGAECHRASLRA
jgi:hypothetical protein